MQTVLLVIHLLLAIALVITVLLQRSEGGALGIGGSGGGAGGGLFSARGTANALTRTTAILAALFMITSLALTIVAGAGRDNRSILDRITSPTPEAAAPAESKPADANGTDAKGSDGPAVPLSK